MGNSNISNNKPTDLEIMVKPIKEIYEKLNNEIKNGLNNILFKRVWPDSWYDEEKSYSYSSKEDFGNSKKSFKITFYPNGTCSTLQSKNYGKEVYIDHFGFGVFFPTAKGINVEVVILGTTYGWELKHQVCDKYEFKEFYFGRRISVNELISYSELIADNDKGPYVLLSSD